MGRAGGGDHQDDVSDQRRIERAQEQQDQTEEHLQVDQADEDTQQPAGSTTVGRPARGADSGVQRHDHADEQDQVAEPGMRGEDDFHVL
ncbi:MAG: hypothetical protein ACRELD_12065 [Longimicrobiales bacterium]